METARRPSWMTAKMRLLVVDDEQNVLDALGRVFRDSELEVHYTSDPRQALHMIDDLLPDLVLSDQRMPEVSGLDILRYHHKKCPDGVRMLITAYNDMDIAVAAINESNVFRYIAKPWDNEMLLQFIDEAVRVRKERLEDNLVLDVLLDESSKWKQEEEDLRARMIEQSHRAVRTLLQMMKIRDSALYRHSRRVARYARYLACCKGLSEERVANVWLAGLLHDIGKIAVRDSVLYKPGRLTDREYEDIKQHPLRGAEVLREMGFMDQVATIVIQHHERIDGSGYPYGLKGEAIGLEGRIVGIADVFDALISKRDYKRAFTKAQAIEILRKGSPEFEPELIDFLAKNWKTAAN